MISSYKMARYLKTTGLYLFLLAAVIVALFPFYWVLSTSFKYPRDHFSKPPVAFPVEYTTSHYYELLRRDKINGLPYIKNSLAIAMVNMVFVVAISVPASYVLGRYRPGGRKMTFAILMGRMLPPVVVVLPLFLLYRALRLNDTYLGMTLSYTIFNGPLAVWLLMTFFEDFPTEIIDAALVDGCTEFRALIQVVTPLILPGVVVVALFCFLTGWNDLIFVLALGGKNTQTLNLLMVALLNQPSADLFGPAAAAVVVGTIPPFILTLFLQRYLVKGLTLGGVKG